jgi:hypothetical protein
LCYNSGERISDFGKDVTVAVFRRAPTSEDLSLQLRHPSHQFFVLQEMFLELLNAAISTVFIDLKGVRPYAARGAGDVMVLPSDVDVIRVFKPLQ